MKNKLNIAFCIFKYYPFGGAQRDMLKFANALIKRKYHVTVFTMKWEGKIPEGISVEIVKVKGISNHKRALNFSNKINQVIDRNKYSTVVGFNKMAELDVYFAADVCFIEDQKSKKLYFFKKLTNRYKLFSSLENEVFGQKSKTKIMMISKQQYNVYEKYYIGCKKRMELLPPGTSFPEFDKNNNPTDFKLFIRKELNLPLDCNIILQVGSDFKRKGVDRSIIALASLDKTIRKNTFLVIIGLGKQEKYIRLAKKLKINNNVLFLGGRKDVPVFLKGADLLIHPAYTENTGTVLLEAIVMGLPVICSGICGYSNYIEKSNAGIALKEPFDQFNLNKELQNLLNNQGLLKSFSKKALSFSKKEDLYSMHERGADIIIASCCNRADQHKI